MKYNISKELFEAVMGTTIISSYIEDTVSFGYQCAWKNLEYEWSYINVDTFFFKCKEWALEQEYEVFSSGIKCSIYEIGNGWIVDQIKSDSEQQAIFDACEWILENKENEMSDLEYKIKVMQHFADGGKIEAQEYDGSWLVVERPVWNWHNTNYRIKEEQKPTKEVFEWIYKYKSIWYIDSQLMTEDEANNMEKQYNYTKTGRSFIVECE